MRAVVRLLLFIVGVTLAISAGTMFLLFASIFDSVVGEAVATMTVFAAIGSVWAAADPEDMLLLLAAAWAVATSVLVAPPALVALIGEVARLGSFVWYCGATGVLTAALPWIARGGVGDATPEEMRVTLALFLTGVVSGFVYWAVAGHSAGRRETPLTAGA